MVQYHHEAANTVKDRMTHIICTHTDPFKSHAADYSEKQQQSNTIKTHWGDSYGRFALYVHVNGSIAEWRKLDNNTPSLLCLKLIANTAKPHHRKPYKAHNTKSNA